MTGVDRNDPPFTVAQILTIAPAAVRAINGIAPATTKVMGTVAPMRMRLLIGFRKASFSAFQLSFVILGRPENQARFAEARRFHSALNVATSILSASVNTTLMLKSVLPCSMKRARMSVAGSAKEALA